MAQFIVYMKQNCKTKKSDIKGRPNNSGDSTSIGASEFKTTTIRGNRRGEFEYCFEIVEVRLFDPLKKVWVCSYAVNQPYIAEWLQVYADMS